MAKFSMNFALFFVCLTGLAVGQTITKPSLNPPPDSLFNETRYPANTDVPFIYSLKELNITFEEANGSVIAIMKYHVRVKIFDASVPKASVVGIPYYAKNNIEKITSIHGITWQNPHEGTRLKPKDIRTINLNGRYKLKEFTMPDVKMVRWLNILIPSAVVILKNYLLFILQIRFLPFWLK